MADIPFDEWRRAQLAKAPATGGRQTSVTPAFAPPALRPNTSGASAGPPATIDDVDMEANWYSPFQPVAPFGPPAISAPREWDYPTGYNLQYVQPRVELMAMLRGLRSSWGVLATIIETRKDQLLRIPWTIQRKDKPRASTKFVDEMRQFFRRPDRKLSYSQWSRKLLDDLLVIDAPTIFFPRNALGRPMAAEVLDGACYSADTEVLTRRGWIKFSEAYTDDEFATRNSTTKLFEWQKAHNFHYQDWTGRPMVRFSSRTLDLLVTPTHRMLVQVKSTVGNKGNSSEHVLSAQEVVDSMGNWCIPQTSEWEGFPIGKIQFLPTNVRGTASDKLQRSSKPSLSGHVNARPGIVKICESCGDNFVVHAYRANAAKFCSNHCRRQGLAKTVTMSGDDFCAFMGMWLSEGCIVDNDRILISQQVQSKGYLEFRELLTRVNGGREPYYNSSGGYWDFHARCMYTYLEQFGHAPDKFVPEEIKNATKHQLEIFWHFFMLGDGCFSEEREQIATSSVTLAGDLQEIAQKLGVSAGVYEKVRNGVSVIGDREIRPTTKHFSVRVRNSTHIGIEHAETVANYQGNVYCVSVPNEFLYVRRNGRPTWCGNTIFPLIDDSGRRPDSTVRLSDEGLIYLERQPAFQQIIKGLPLVDLDEAQLMYVPMRPRADFPIFGYPPTEQILIEASEAVRKTVYQLNFWAEGTIPDLIVSVPEIWTPRQIAAFQAHFDAMLSGNLNLKSKVRFLPGGMKPFDVKNASGESLWSQRDETLIRLACYAYSVSPTPFVKQTNRATAQNAQQTAEEEGLYPLMSFWKDDIMDPIIQERFGYDDIEFVFQPRPEPDQEKSAKIHDMKIKNGEMSRDEARAEDGLEPIPGGDVFTIQVGNAVIPLEMAAAGHAMPALGGDGKSGDAPSGGAKGPAPTPSAVPLRGPARPTHASPSPIHKLLGAILRKASPAELAAAIADAKGHLADYSQVQLKNGNFPKGHVWIQGLNVSIENAPGSKRGEKDESGVKWEVTMPSAYGYVRGTIGADGEALDVYIGNAPDARTVWVIDQNKVSRKGKIKGFDEHKAMICYDDLEVALFDYLASHFDGHGHERLGDVVELSMKDFKRWLRDGDLKAPIAPQAGIVILRSGALAKALDTISTATNLASRGAAPRRKRKKSRRRGPQWLTLGALA